MNINKTILTSILAASFVVGCASGPEKSERDFGNSVRAANKAQILDPVAASNPDMTPVGYTDGQRMENVLDNYRKDVTRRTPYEPAIGAVGDTDDLQ
jgi:type IV pilus biogenesis protein CpaD/CtpE